MQSNIPKFIFLISKIITKYFSFKKISDYGLTGIHADGKRYYSLKNLKGLQVLKCSGLYKITDLSLIDSFNLLELKEVYFARCTAITEDGIKSLVKNCRSLEYLDLSECKKINDAAVEYITNLPRLKTLKLNGCQNVTDKSVTTIYESCKELKVGFFTRMSLHFIYFDWIKLPDTFYTLHSNHVIFILLIRTILRSILHENFIQIFCIFFHRICPSKSAASQRILQIFYWTIWNPWEKFIFPEKFLLKQQFIWFIEIFNIFCFHSRIIIVKFYF